MSGYEPAGSSAGTATGDADRSLVCRDERRKRLAASPPAIGHHRMDNPSSRAPISPSAVRRVNSSQACERREVRFEIAVSSVVNAWPAEMAQTAFHFFQPTEHFRK